MLASNANQDVGETGDIVEAGAARWLADRALELSISLFDRGVGGGNADRPEKAGFACSWLADTDSASATEGKEGGGWPMP